MDICIDFDGTCVTHEYPNIGKDIGAAPVLKELVKNGHRLILFTIRSDGPKVNDDRKLSLEYTHYLSDAIDWFTQNGIPLYGVQTNPTQSKWTSSPKAYGNLYIDDSALGCPLIYPEGGRPFVDWIAVRDLLIEMGLLGKIKERWGSLNIFV